MRGSRPKQVGPNRWRFVYDLPRMPGGARHQKTRTVTAKTKKEAESLLTAALQAANTDEFCDDPSYTVKQAFQDYFVGSKRSLEPTTLERYMDFNKTYVTPKLGALRLTKLRAKHLDVLYDQLLAGPRRDGKPGGLSPQTVRHVHRFIRRVLQVNVKQRRITWNPADQVTAPSVPKQERPTLQPLEVVRLLQAAQTPPPHCRTENAVSLEAAFYPALAFMVYTGCRRGEAFAVKWDDCDLEKEMVVIKRSLQQTRTAGLREKPPKNGRFRRVGLSRDLVAILRTHKAAQNKQRLALGSAYTDNGLIFARADGTHIPPHMYGDAFRALVRRAKVSRITLHDIRHSHASLLALANVPMKIVSERLGHSGIAITADTYSHVFASQDMEAAAAFDELLNKAAADGP